MPIIPEPRDPADFPNWRFPTLDFDYDPATRSVWMSFKADGPPCFTLEILNDLAAVGLSLRRLFADDAVRRSPVHYVALASNKPGVFNLGGDLALFVKAIRTGSRDRLRDYAHACIDVVYGGVTGYGLPIVSLAVIAGKALGGGLEAALANDVLFADVDATLGVPEVAFNTFPGMGAVTLLTRRIGAGRVSSVIGGGKTYSAQAMLDLGVIDKVTPRGASVQAVLDWMSEGGEEKRRRRLAVVQARRTCLPVSRAELIRIVDVWTDCAFDVAPRDIRHMERLAAAQQNLSSVD